MNGSDVYSLVGSVLVALITTVGVLLAARWRHQRVRRTDSEVASDFRDELREEIQDLRRQLEDCEKKYAGIIETLQAEVRACERRYEDLLHAHLTLQTEVVVLRNRIAKQEERS